MGRSPCCEKDHTNKGAWTKEEDDRLIGYIRSHGQGSWRSLPKSAGLQRCGKSCRLRWINYLRPDLKRGNFTHEEDQLIIQLQSLLGNKWSMIAGRLPGRTDNEIKNYWNTHIKRKLLLQMHHSPLVQNSTVTVSSSSRDSNNTNVSKGDEVSLILPTALIDNAPPTRSALGGAPDWNDDQLQQIPPHPHPHPHPHPSTTYSNNSSGSGSGSGSGSALTCSHQPKPEVNLELSIGLPNSSKVEQHQNVGVVCLCYSLGFQKSLPPTSCNCTCTNPTLPIIL